MIDITSCHELIDLVVLMLGYFYLFGDKQALTLHLAITNVVLLMA